MTSRKISQYTLSVQNRNRFEGGRVTNFIFINVTPIKLSASSDAYPISMGYILAYLKKFGHGGVILDDVMDRPLSLYVLETWIEKLQPAAVGFTAYQHNMERIRFFSSYVKSRHRNIKVIIGGPQAIFMPSDALRELEDVDIVCRGEGETVMVEFADCLTKNGSLATVSGITFREGDQIIDTPPNSKVVEDLDDFPSPYLTGIINLEGKEQALVFTSRGCKFNCLFCISPASSHGKMRYHSANRVLDEMEYLTKKGIKRFWFADSSFPESRERALEILEGKIDRGIATPFWSEVRCDLVDEEILRKLREANAETISFGLESANPEVLRKTSKGIVLEDLRRMIQIAKSIGLNVELSCMYGLPDETVEKAHDTLDFVKSCGLPIDGNSRAQQLRLFFGSAYQNYPSKFGFKPIPGFMPRYMSFGDRYETNAMTSNDLQKIGAIWMLSWEELRRQVYNKELAFDVLNFILTNEKNLLDEPTFYEFGAIASCAVEDKELLLKFLNGYKTRLNPEESYLTQLLSKLNIFQETNERANATSRLIFDGRSELNGAPSPGMKDGYWDVQLGQNLFPPSFEKGLMGARSGEKRTFEFKFPEFYVPIELRSKTVKVSGRVLKVLNSVHVNSIDELKSVNIRNHYQIEDLDRLLQESNLLHYLTLRDFPELELVKAPMHFLTQINHYAALHKIEEIDRMAKLVANDHQALTALADALYWSGRYLQAANYYGLAGNGSSTLIKQARAFFMDGEARKALEVLDHVSEKDDLLYQELRLDCMKLVDPDSAEIPALDRRVLRLKVEDALDKEIMDQTEGAAVETIVHGFKS